MRCPKCGCEDVAILQETPKVDLLEGYKFTVVKMYCLKCSEVFTCEIKGSLKE